MYRDRPRTLNELKTAITAYTKNISKADLQKVFVNKIKRFQACIDARGHHIQHLFLSAQRLFEHTVLTERKSYRKGTNVLVNGLWRSKKGTQDS
jgi:hypothetical protein